MNVIDAATINGCNVLSIEVESTSFVELMEDLGLQPPDRGQSLTPLKWAGVKVHPFQMVTDSC